MPGRLSYPGNSSCSDTKTQELRDKGRYFGTLIFMAANKSFSQSPNPIHRVTWVSFKAKGLNWVLAPNLSFL